MLRFKVRGASPGEGQICYGKVRPTPYVYYPPGLSSLVSVRPTPRECSDYGMRNWSMESQTESESTQHEWFLNAKAVKAVEGRLTIVVKYFIG